MSDCPNCDDATCVGCGLTVPDMDVDVQPRESKANVRAEDSEAWWARINMPISEQFDLRREQRT